MKNLILSLLAILIITSLYSCKKKYTCNCHGKIHETINVKATNEEKAIVKCQEQAAPSIAPPGAICTLQ